MISCKHSTVMVCVSEIYSAIIDKIAILFIPNPVDGDLVSISPQFFYAKNTKGVGLLNNEKSDCMFSCFDTVHECDSRTDIMAVRDMALECNPSRVKTERKTVNRLCEPVNDNR